MTSTIVFPLDRSFLVLGSVFALLAVAFGAFGAHALRARLTSDQLAIYQTGVQYQMYHALGLVILGAIIPHLSNVALGLFAGRLFVVGIILFSGSLYVLAMGGKRFIGAITPFGGLAFIAGWLCLLLSCLR